MSKINQQNYQTQQLWTAKEVCSYYQINPSTLYRWQRARLIPVEHLGKITRYDPQDVKRALAKLDRPPKKPKLDRRKVFAAYEHLYQLEGEKVFIASLVSRLACKIADLQSYIAGEVALGKAAVFSIPGEKEGAIYLPGDAVPYVQVSISPEGLS